MPEYSVECPQADELVSLYASVGWTGYTKDPTGLVTAVANSTFVVAARERQDLVGLARVLSDDHTVMYLQDVLVRPDRQGGGIGRELVGRCLERFSHCRQKVLLTDDEDRQHRLYRSLGFEEIADVERLHGFVRFD